MPTTAQHKRRLALKNMLRPKEKPLDEQVEVIVSKLLQRFVMDFMTNKMVIDKITKIVVSNVRMPQDGKDADENRIINTVLGKIRQPEDGKTPSRSELEALIRPLIPKVKDGKDADEKRIIEKVLARLPKVKDGKTPIKGVDFFTSQDKKEMAEVAATLVEKLTGEEIVEAINSLPVEPTKQIDAKHIKGLSDRRDGAKLGGGIHRGGLKLIWNTVLEGDVDGSNTVFTIPASLPDPVDDKYIVEARGGFKSVNNGDFTVSNSNRTITFTQAPPNGSNQPRIAIYQGH